MIYVGPAPRHRPCTDPACQICAATDFEQVSEDHAEARGIGLWAEDMFADAVMRDEL